MAAISNQMQKRLVEECREGSRTAQYELYKRYSRAMFNTSLRILGKEAEAEDVLQESFLDAFLRIDSFRGQSSFGAWLKRIVVNKSINQLHKRKVELVPLEQADYQEPVVQAEEETPRIYNPDHISEAIERLPEGYRVVFTLYILEGYDHQEISEILGISVSGSKSQLNRAKNKIREILKEKSYV